MCGHKVMLTVYDPRRKSLYSFHSSPDFDLKAIRAIVPSHFERLTNEDYDTLKVKKGTEPRE